MLEVFLEQYSGRSVWITPLVSSAAIELFMDMVGSMGVRRFLQDNAVQLLGQMSGK